MSLSDEIEYYKQSLREAEEEIKRDHENGKALKDVVGNAFETHRRRIWEHNGFNVSKETYGAKFNVDWSIKYKDKLIAFEEDKGHYLDSCFMERAITGFSKTVCAYQREKKEVPILIIHSFARYAKFNEKLEEDLVTRKAEIEEEVRKKLHYTTLTGRDRIPKDRWFSKNSYNSYQANVEEELIIEDIKFIRSLIPSHSE
jgi:hypothetical protein